MKKLCLALVIILMVSVLGGCGQRKPELKGAYQSEAGKIENIVAVLISFDQKDNSFVEYIDNRQVDAGTFEKVKDDTSVTFQLSLGTSITILNNIKNCWINT